MRKTAARLTLFLAAMVIAVAGGCASQHRYDLVSGVCPLPLDTADLVRSSPVLTARQAGDVRNDGNTVDDQLYALIAGNDPVVRVNRGIYAFNAVFDRYVFLPIVDAYEFAVPEILRDRIHDFFSNLGDFRTFGNLVLQGRFGPAGETAFRVLVNSGLGFFGFIDIASASGIPKYAEDFGQTLGCWGVGDGPYVMLPVLGPSNARDSAGLLVDAVVFWVIDPFGISSFESDHPYLIALDAIDTRAHIPFEYFSTGSPFEYEYVRLLYTKKRQADLRN